MTSRARDISVINENTISLDGVSFGYEIDHVTENHAKRNNFAGSKALAPTALEYVTVCKNVSYLIDVCLGGTAKVAAMMEVSRLTLYNYMQGKSYIPAARAAQLIGLARQEHPGLDVLVTDLRPDLSLSDKLDPTNKDQTELC